MMDWRYSGKVVKIVDGRTVIMRMALMTHQMVKDESMYHDLGFRIFAPLVDADRPILFDVAMCLAGLEIPGDGSEAAYKLTNMIRPGTIVIVETHQVVGGYEGVFFKDGVNVNEWMVEKGYANVLQLSGPETVGVIGDPSGDGEVAEAPDRSDDNQ